MLVFKRLSKGGRGSFWKCIKWWSKYLQPQNRKRALNPLHACKDALLTVFKGHIVAAACTELNIGDLKGT